MNIRWFRRTDYDRWKRAQAKGAIGSRAMRWLQFWEDAEARLAAKGQRVSRIASCDGRLAVTAVEPISAGDEEV